MYEFIPEELKQKRNWVVWKAVPDERSHSGISKIPINPNNGWEAKTNTPETWGDFETAVRVSSDYAGIGFVFDGGGYFGVDLDDMKDIEAFKNGDINNIVGEFVYGLQSYTELSQSGHGIHIICKGKLPEGKRRSGGFEMYEKGRFFVMTGNCCSEFADITDCTETIKPLHAKYLGNEPPKSRLSKGPVAPVVSLDMTQAEIIEKAKSAANGDKFAKLYNGDCTEYSSQSEADMAFCNLLAFWCKCDIETMDSIYRSSGLMREKWDRKQSGSTYGRLTLQKAIEGCESTYSSEMRNSENYHISIGAKEKLRKKHYSFDDTGNAERLFDAFGGVLRYCYTDKKWLYYRDGKWNYDNLGEVHRCVDAVLEYMRQEGMNMPEGDEKGEPEEREAAKVKKAFMAHLTKTRASNRKKAMLKETEHKVPILPRNMDTQKELINCKNGILNLRTGEIIPHDKNLYMTKMLNVPMPDVPKEPKLWLKFLDDIFSGDKELIRYIQKAVGYSLTGSTAEQCVFFLYGTGRNGKSTFIEIIRHIMGDYAANIQADTIMVKRNNGSANSDIARLKGARMVTSSESNEGMRIDEGLIKQLSGGDVVTARKLYGEEFEFKPEFKLFMATNHKPIIRGTDTGIWRRIHIIPFEVSIPAEKVDKNLKYKLKDELPDILAWAVEGCRLWREEGLRLPPAIAKAVEEYKKESDVISSFVEACCMKGTEVRANVLYAEYAKWASENNEYKMSSNKFGREISKIYKKIKQRDGWYYMGVQLIQQSYSISVG